MQRFLNALLFCAFLHFSSCTKDKLPPEDTTCTDTITYVQHVKPIIDASCAYSGCHVAGFAYGNHSSYATLEPQLRNGLFSKWVIEERQMPPSSAPADKPKSLTIEQIDILRCWAMQGFQEL